MNSPERLPPMTRAAVWRVIREVLKQNSLTEASVRTSTWYHDYAAMEFAMFHTDEAERTIRTLFSALCTEHGWKVCEVRAFAASNAFRIVMQAGVRSAHPATEARMPDGADFDPDNSMILTKMIDTRRIAIQTLHRSRGRFVCIAATGAAPRIFWTIESIVDFFDEMIRGRLTRPEDIAIAEGV